MPRPWILILPLALLLAAACGGGGDGSRTGLESAGTQGLSLELVDPTPGPNNFFGTELVVLTNGNVVVTEPQDSGAAANGGAVHLFNTQTRARTASIYGDTALDFLGSSGVTALSTGNYVIASSGDDVGGLVDAGSVMLFDGVTGVQIGVTLAGDQAEDQFGFNRIAALSTGNYVIASSGDDVGGVVDAGSVMLVDGMTGVQIGTTLTGDQVGDSLGSRGVTALSNGNYVVASSSDDVGGLVDAGSVMLFDGVTGVQIGVTLAGDQAEDHVGSDRVTALNNGNFVVASSTDNVGAFANTGSVMLVDGTTGMVIGGAISGGRTNAFFPSSVTSLSNGNYVVASSNDDVGGVVNAGSVMLVDGMTGAQIGVTLTGNDAGDFFGQVVTALSNGNFVVTSPQDDVGGVGDAGSAMLFDGTNGQQIGDAVTGGEIADLLGFSGVTALSSGNYVVASSKDDVGGVEDAGSVILLNGATGAQIGSPIVGDQVGDLLGTGRVTALSDSNYLIASHFDDAGSVMNAGSVMLVNGTTGALIETISGRASGDMAFTAVSASPQGGFAVLGFPLWDNAGGVDSGYVRLIFP